MANSKTAAALVEAFSKFVNEVYAAASSNGSSAPDKVVDEATGEVVLDRDEVMGLSIVELRKLAKSHGIDEKKKADILAAFEEKDFFPAEASDDSDEEEEDDEEINLDDVEADDEDEDEDDDEEDEDEEDDGYTREELSEKSLRELRAIAKSDEGGNHDAADLKGLDQEELIDLILGEEEDEDDDDEADEDDEDDDDEEEVEIDKETLEAMSDAELKNIVKEFEIKVPAKAKRKTIIQAILDAVEDEDDD